MRWEELYLAGRCGFEELLTAHTHLFSRAGVFPLFPLKNGYSLLYKYWVRVSFSSLSHSTYYTFQRPGLALADKYSTDLSTSVHRSLAAGSSSVPNPKSSQLTLAQSLYVKLKSYLQILLLMASTIFGRTVKAASKTQVLSQSFRQGTFISGLAVRPASAPLSKFSFAGAIQHQTRGVKTIDFAGSKETVYGGIPNFFDPVVQY